MTGRQKTSVIAGKSSTGLCAANDNHIWQDNQTPEDYKSITTTAVLRVPLCGITGLTICISLLPDADPEKALPVLQKIFFRRQERASGKSRSCLN
ncbi:MAG: hypothetical protein MZV63_61580 [Marinilabiliales bacterium]|nr:hypothetical protein [Marinilabiliales bacterium]